MAKKGKLRNRWNPDIHFVSSLQLEQSVRLLGSLADEYHRVTLTEVTGDEFRFEFAYYPEGLKEAYIRGELKRWNGNETRLDANNGILSDSELASTGCRLFLVTLMTMIALFFVFLATVDQGVLVQMFFVSGFGLLGLGQIDNFRGTPSGNDRKSSSSKSEYNLFVLYHQHLEKRLKESFETHGELQMIESTETQ